jgi:cyclophilin family peptidyl-prolyl cis-trans isomerase
MAADAAPLAVERFLELAMTNRYYDGLTFHRVVPNFVVQGGSPGDNEYSGDKTFMRDEIGAATNVRGSVGVSTRGRNTGDAQFFVNLVDNPRLDYDYTIFATVFPRDMAVVDAIEEGDAIARIRGVSCSK